MLTVSPSPGVGKYMDKAAEDLELGIDSKLAQFGKSKNAQIPESVLDLLNSDRFRNTNRPLAEARRG